MTPGAFGGNELMTPDSGAARPFYGALFGWETEDSPGEGTNDVPVKVGGAAVGEMMAVPPECAGRPPASGVYVTVADVDATARQGCKLSAVWSHFDFGIMAPPELRRNGAREFSA